jgi:DNA-binding IclR family transcriptional regulator
MRDRTAEILQALGTQEALDLVVEMLERPQGTSITELQEATAYNQPKITRTIQVLERAGLVERGQGESPLALAHAEDVRRLVDGAAALAGKALAEEVDAVTGRQRRVRKSRLRGATDASAK